ncbi:MAG TPA: prepilin-type N-terminal cleavage/methylation domain-containing protein [Desulfobacterales bacterium]|nr:prepilin-type N-terminal cleavage/methylation domain-containing protein [Desulfobacterales bacterium]
MHLLSFNNLRPANARGSRIRHWSARLIARCSLLTSKIHRPQADGFTLMEILVAVFILGIVVTTVMASFSMVFSTTAAMEEADAAFEMGKNCLNRITTDLENIVIAERPFYKPPKTDGPLDGYRLQGTDENIGGTRFAKLRLASRAHVPLDGNPREGIAELVYYVQARADGSRQLKRADHLYPYPRFEERSSDPVLCENVKSLAFLYYAEDGTDSETWDSESEAFANATPAMVAVRLEIAAGDDVFFFQTTVRLPLVRKKQG